MHQAILVRSPRDGTAAHAALRLTLTQVVLRHMLKPTRTVRMRRPRQQTASPLPSTPLSLALCSHAHTHTRPRLALLRGASLLLHDKANSNAGRRCRPWLALAVLLD